MLTDMLIIGLSNKRIQERFLLEDDISLEKVIKNCKTEELTSIQGKCIQKGISNADHVNIDYVKDRVAGSTYSKEKKTPSNYKNKSIYKKEKIQNCKFCSYSHDRFLSSLL